MDLDNVNGCMTRILRIAARIEQTAHNVETKPRLTATARPRSNPESRPRPPIIPRFKLHPMPMRIRPHEPHEIVKPVQIQVRFQ